jgi:crotonobetainyl-CoA:carnitine CoA-transferase CaiB-like acyl-CoA transferase
MAAGYCTKLLAGLGAEVIKVEPPGKGDAVRSMRPFKDDIPNVETSAVHLHLSMGKKSITLEPGSETARRLLDSLLSTADVMVETYEGDDLARLGLTYDEVSAAHPDLIVTSITDFGREGPYANYKGGELVDYSAGGYTFLTGLPDRVPIKAGGSQAQYQGGLHAAGATLSALLLRDQTGRGDHLDVSIVEAICFTHGGMAPFLNSNNIYRRVGARLLSNAPTAPYPSTILPARDGFVHAHWSPADPHLMGVLTENPRLGDPELWATPRAHADEIDTLLTEWLAGLDRAEAVRRAQELRHPFTVVLTPADLIDDPQFVERGFFTELDHPVAGPMKHLGAPFRMSDTAWESRRAPLLGEHNAEIYCERLGLSLEELSLLRERGIV